MVSAMDNRKNSKRPVLYSRGNINKSDDPLIVDRESFGYMTSCPECKRRVFDVYDPPDRLTRIQIKCPHCRKVVKIPIYEHSKSKN